MQKSVAQNCFEKTLLDTVNLKLFGDGAPSQDIDVLCNYKRKKNTIIVCFGTPLISGDAFGPLVARSLRELGVSVFVYGTPENSVNGKNLEDWLSFIRIVHKDCLILSVDASLGDNVGSVVVRKDGVCPAAIKGRKHRFGDVGVLGIVAKNEGDALMRLMSVDYNFVEQMAKSAAKKIFNVIS